ncbi:MAG TPA: amidohydrolase family protein [Candidatus Acidoferrales bacterium]|nr:amidohydrolase family protein [Candidatus Acidoferrales bacterium]
MIRLGSLIFFFGLLVTRALAQNVPPELLSYPDTILHNGKIVALDDKSNSTNLGSIFQALAVRDGKILALGTNDQILALKGPQTRIIDVKGRTVVPGIIDTHSHLFDYAMDSLGDASPRMRIRAEQGETWASIAQKTLAAVRQEVAKKKPGEWIALDLPRQALDREGKPMDAVQAAMRGQIVTRAELDKIAPENPVYLRTRTSSITNGKAQELIRAGWHGPVEPNLMREDGFSSNTINRMVLSDHLIGDIEKLAKIYKEENLRWAGYGITTWSSNLRSLKILAAYKLLDKRGEMGIRFAYTPGVGTPAQVVPEMNGVEGYGSDYLWFVGASMRGVDASYPGILTTIEPPEIPKEIKDREIHNVGYTEFIENAVASGLRWAGTHTAGDKALDLTLDAIEKGSARAGFTLDQIRAKGHAIDHCTMNPRPDQIPRLQKLNIIMSCSPKYIEGSPRVLRDYGEKYLSWVAPVKSLLDANVKTVLEIDDNEIFKVGTVFHYIDVLVNREVEGKVYNGRERIDRVRALKMSTIWAAEYVQRQDRLGSLERGKLADLLVLDKDYFSVPEKEIRTIRPLLTMVGGKIVHQKAEF